MSVKLHVAEILGDEFVDHGAYEFVVAPAKDDQIQIRIGDHFSVFRALYIEHRVTDIELEKNLLTAVVIAERL